MLGHSIQLNRSALLFETATKDGFEYWADLSEGSGKVGGKAGIDKRSVREDPT
jgi:hypothetical protein